MAELLDHEYDGIQEYDNPIPTWLAQLFFFTIVFGIGYAIYYPSFWFYGGVSKWSSTQQYDQQMEKEETRYAPLREAAQKKALEALASLSSDPATLSAGKEVFTARCAPCHGANGEGKIGPNLTDAEWLYGGEAKDILESVRNGRPKGMPAWKNDLKKEEVQNVTAFVISLSPEAGQQPAAEATPESAPTPEVSSTPEATASPVASATPAAAEAEDESDSESGEEG